MPNLNPCLAWPLFYFPGLLHIQLHALINLPNSSCQATPFPFYRFFLKFHLFHQARCSAALLISWFWLCCVVTVDYKPKGCYIEQEAEWLGHRLWSQWVQILALLLINCVTLNKLFNFTKLSFPHLQNGHSKLRFPKMTTISPIPHYFLGPCHFLLKGGLLCVPCLWICMDWLLACDQLNAVEIMLHDFRGYVRKSDAASAWLAGTLTLEPSGAMEAIWLPRTYHALRKPKWVCMRNHIEKLWKYSWLSLFVNLLSVVLFTC